HVLHSLHVWLDTLRPAVDRAQPVARKLAGMGSRKPGVHIALGVEPGAYRDQIWRNVQYVCDDLGRGCLMSLALRTRAYRDDNLAVDIKLAVGALRIAGERRIGIDDLRLSEIVGARVERCT